MLDYQDSIGRKIVIGYGNDREDDEEEYREKTRENDGEMTRRGAEKKQGIMIMEMARWRTKEKPKEKHQNKCTETDTETTPETKAQNRCRKQMAG